MADEQGWSQLELTVPTRHEDMASWVLVQGGALGCEVLPHSDEQVVIRASFDKHVLDQEKLQNLAALLEEYGLSDTLRSLKVSDIPKEDWLAKWKEGFEPFRVGTKFVVCPLWRKDDLSPEISEGRNVIFIEPGMAFGTGLHTTTQFCLRALEAYKPEGNVLDVGTGSGILAIACKMVNPEANVIGVDTDPLSIEAAETDLKVNNLEGKVDLRLGSTETVADMQFDMILSNLTCEDIIALLPDYVRMLKPGAKVIGAGILKEKLEMLKGAISRYPVNIEHAETLGNWVGIVLQR
ncbi:50S ribosomal protein L11 methyltransferase [Candidatus Obscuribacterales bacterium]|nr:50S ribosomal protein L11 methyltransferase [Candidatus Obscuribacterales bacterium]